MHAWFAPPHLIQRLGLLLVAAFAMFCPLT